MMAAGYDARSLSEFIRQDGNSNCLVLILNSKNSYEIDFGLSREKSVYPINGLCKPDYDHRIRMEKERTSVNDF